LEYVMWFCDLRQSPEERSRKQKQDAAAMLRIASG